VLRDPLFPQEQFGWTTDETIVDTGLDAPEPNPTDRHAKASWMVWGGSQDRDWVSCPACRIGTPVPYWAHVDSPCAVQRDASMCCCLRPFSIGLQLRMLHSLPHAAFYSLNYQHSAWARKQSGMPICLSNLGPQPLVILHFLQVLLCQLLLIPVVSVCPDWLV
jgi:hypothetical protein